MLVIGTTTPNWQEECLLRGGLESKKKLAIDIISNVHSDNEEKVVLFLEESGFLKINPRYIDMRIEAFI